MRVAKWGNSLALRLPAKVVKALELAEGDEVELRATGPRTLEIARDDERAWAMRRIREISKPLPPGWKFDRDEANERGGRDEPDEP
jgi:antitoxin MazE